MKFAERVLILMYVMGFYLAVFRRPAQPDLAFISTAGLALVQLLFMPFLLQQATLKDVITRQPERQIALARMGSRLAFWHCKRLHGFQPALS